MVRVQEVMEALERIAPKRLAEDWDNPGLLVGSPEGEVARVLVALDVSDQVVKTAIREGAGMIVAHHPLIFSAIKKIRTDTPLGARLQMLLSHDIAVAAAHTNLDIAKGGVNDVLAERLGLEKLSTFITNEQEGGDAESLGRIGALPAPVSIEDFAHTVRERLGVSHVRLVRAAARPVRRVAVVGGAGAEFIDAAVRRGADVYITGDVKYHEAQRAVEQGMHLIDAGHFGTERPVLPVLAGLLRRELAAERGTAAIFVTETQRDVFDVII